MANQSNDVQRLSKNESAPWEYGVVGYTNMQGGSVVHTIYKGAIVMMDVSDVDGYAQSRDSAINATSSDVFLGVAAEKVAVTADDTADGSKKVRVWRKGIFAFPVGSLAKTDIGAPIYASSSQDVTTTSTNNLWIGTLVDVDATWAWVEIDQATGQANSAT